MITVYTETTRIAEVPPYLFFAGLATVAALIPFVAVLLKKDEDLRWFGWQFGLAGLGLLLGGRFFRLFSRSCQLPARRSCAYIC